MSTIAVLGAKGRVGLSTATALRRMDLPVRAILRDASKSAELEKMGCEVIRADLQDAGALANAMRDASAVQVIVPLSPSKQDPVADLWRTIESVVQALIEARPPRILAISDYGAHVAEDIGMPSVFREFEARLRELDAHKIVLRSAEHMHNWGRSIPAAIESGTLMTFQNPVEKPMPTIVAEDLGRIAASLLARPASREGLEVVHAEGPRRYSASDVAEALSRLLSRTIRAQAIPRSQWNETLERGMPASLAELLIKANDAKNKGGLVDVEPNRGELRHGSTLLDEALRPLLRAAGTG